jgi:hypothetical protein
MYLSITMLKVEAVQVQVVVADESRMMTVCRTVEGLNHQQDLPIGLYAKQRGIVDLSRANAVGSNVEDRWSSVEVVEGVEGVEELENEGRRGGGGRWGLWCEATR